MKFSTSHVSCIKTLDYEYHSHARKNRAFFSLAMEDLSLVGVIPLDPAQRACYVLHGVEDPATAVVAENFLIYDGYNVDPNHPDRTAFIYFMLGIRLMLAPSIAAIDKLAPQVTLIPKAAES